MAVHYLSRGAFAARLGLSRSTLNMYGKRGQLPNPDARIGDIQGWLPDTVDEWNRRRPGKRPKRAAEDWYVMEHSTITYLSSSELAARIGVTPKAAAQYKLPLVDAEIAAQKLTYHGWLPITVDEWNARRPGKRTSRASENWHLPPELQRR